VRVQPASRGIPDDTFLQGPAATPPTPTPAPASTPLPPGAASTLELSHSSAEPVGVLIAVDGPITGTAVAIPHGRVTIGRKDSCEVALEDPYLSGESLLVISDGHEIAIQPLGARNPVRMNGQDVPHTGACLQDGDLLQMGGSVFSFRTTRPAALPEPGA